MRATWTENVQPNDRVCLPSPVHKRPPRIPSDMRFIAHDPFATRKDAHLADAVVQKSHAVYQTRLCTR
jgi:hypothetical protein